MYTRRCLPKYRGAAPIQWAIARGETRTGVTTMRIDAGLDTGDMLLKCGNGNRRGRNGDRTFSRGWQMMGADLLERTLAGLSGH